MASYSHTLSFKKNNQSVYRSCSFKSKPSTKGDHWQVHDGFIMDNLLGKLPAVVKIPTNVKTPAAPVAAELRKINLLESVLSSCPKVARSVKVVATFSSDVDKVGRLCRLRGKGDDNTRALREGAKVVVQEKADGDIQCLLDIRQRKQPQHPDSQDPLMTLVHETYTFSGGQCVIAGVKGVKVCDDKGRVTYHVTSLTIHSREKKYGENDEGVEGMALHKAWSGLHHRVQPTAPPPPPPEVTVSDTNADLPRKKSSPPTTKEFRIYPVPESALESKATLPRNFSSQLLSANWADYEELFGKVPQLRSLLSEKSLTKLLGLPPSYSFTGA